MIKKLYFHTREGRSYDFDIVGDDSLIVWELPPVFCIVLV